MKTDQELLEIWERHNDSARDYWIYVNLTEGERERIFDLVSGLKKLEIIRK